MPISFNHLLLIALGGALGAMFRVLLQTASKWAFATQLPLGTLLVNTLGCWLIGVALFYSQKRPELIWFSPLLMTGFCGGFTTFSSYSLETLVLLQKGQIGWALAYAGVSVVLGLFLVYLGYRFMLWIQ